jgi:site-specific recombinase XerD
MEIINKYNSSLDRINKGSIIPTFSNSKINAYLKVIGDLADIKLKLTHHVARHTCATTVLLENNVPLDEVSKWLGHADIRSTRIYAQITKKKLSDTADRLNDIL